MHRLLPDIVYIADAMTRNELASGAIPTEPVYMATLMTRIRDGWRQAGGVGEMYARVVPPNVEQFYGIDVVIHLRTPSVHKILAIEAKRPTFPQKSGRWDEDGRFGKQLMRQRAHLGSGIVSGGFFINSDPHYMSPPGFDLLGGLFVATRTLLRHQASFLKLRKPKRPYWTNGDVFNLITSTHAGSAAVRRGVRNLRGVLNGMLECTLGTRLSSAELKAHLESMIARRRLALDEDESPIHVGGITPQVIAEGFGCAQVLTLDIPWFDGDHECIAKQRHWRLANKPPSTRRTHVRPRS